MSRKLFVTSNLGEDERLIAVAAIDPLADLLWPRFLTSCCDDWGRGTANPYLIKARLAPLNSLVTVEAVEAALQLYAAHGLISLYSVAGARCFAVPTETWFRIQVHIKHAKRDNVDSNYPEPPAKPTTEAEAKTETVPGCATSRAESRDVAQNRASVTVTPSVTESQNVNDADVARAREDAPQPKPPGDPTAAAALQTIQVNLSTEDRAAFDALVPLFPSGNLPVTEQTLLTLLTTYPAVDLVAEARKCVQHRQDRQLTAATAATFDRWVRQAKFPLEQRHTARGHPTLAIVPKPCIIPNRWQVTAPKYARVLGDNAHTQGNRAEERRVAAEERSDVEAAAKAEEQRDRYWRDRDELDRLAEEMDAAVAS